jgi:predicted nucleic acid-binding Zn ribbon protein
VTCAWCSKPVPTDRLLSCSPPCLRKLNEANRRLERIERQAAAAEALNPERAVALFESMTS